MACLALLSSHLSAARTEALSWGKPGISIEQYRNDAVTCGRLGYYADVSNTETARVFRRATRELEANETDLSSPALAPGAATTPAEAASAAMVLGSIVSRSASIVADARPAERMKAVGAFMQEKVDDCLKGRGYVRFKLTANQRQHLSHLHLGSPERHAYLYDLATDPEVLKSQAM